MPEDITTTNNNLSIQNLSIQIANLVRDSLNSQNHNKKNYLSNSLKINLKLTSQNYPLWVRMIRVAIRGKSKALLNHLSDEPPDPADENSDYDQWEQEDLLVFSWLIQNIEPSIASNLTVFPTAKSLWDALATAAVRHSKTTKSSGDCGHDRDWRENNGDWRGNGCVDITGEVAEDGGAGNGEDDGSRGNGFEDKISSPCFNPYFINFLDPLVLESLSKLPQKPDNYKSTFKDLKNIQSLSKNDHLNSLFYYNKNVIGESRTNKKDSETSGQVNMVRTCENLDKHWIFDCGATDTMTFELSDIVSRSKPKINHIKTADGGIAHVKGGGTIEISPTLKLSNCLYVPSLSHKLLSISHVTKELNCTVKLHPTFCILEDIRTGAVIGRGTERQGLYYVDEVTQHGTVMLAHGTPDREAWLWHRRLGHPSIGYLHILFPKLYPSNKTFNCETCVFG